MPDALDPIGLLKHLHEHGVEHIIIGGLAISAHGHVRPSQDLDIVPNPARENLKRLASALADANALDAEAGEHDPAEPPISPLRVEDPSQGGNSPLGNSRLVTDFGDLNVFHQTSGIEAEDLYVELDREALPGNVEGIPVRVCGLDHLRAMKRADGQLQDLADLERLGEG